MKLDDTRVTLARLSLADHDLEGVGTHYSPAAWRSEEGGYVGHADWRDRYNQGSRSYCGHKHRQEADAMACIEATISAASGSIPVAETKPGRTNR